MRVCCLHVLLTHVKVCVTKHAAVIVQVEKLPLHHVIGNHCLSVDRATFLTRLRQPASYHRIQVEPLCLRDMRCNSAKPAAYTAHILLHSLDPQPSFRRPLDC